MACLIYTRFLLGMKSKVFLISKGSIQITTAGHGFQAYAGILISKEINLNLLDRFHFLNWSQ